MYIYIYIDMYVCMYVCIVISLSLSLSLSLSICIGGATIFPAFKARVSNALDSRKDRVRIA